MHAEQVAACGQLEPQRTPTHTPMGSVEGLGPSHPREAPVHLGPASWLQM